MAPCVVLHVILCILGYHCSERRERQSHTALCYSKEPPSSSLGSLAQPGLPNQNFLADHQVQVLSLTR